MSLLLGSAPAIADDSQAEAAAILPPIGAPAVRDLAPGPDEPHYYRSRPPPRVLSLRLVFLSAALRLPVDDVGARLVYAFDTALQYRHALFRGPSVLGLSGEVGYSFLGANGHFLALGAGLALEREAGWSFGLSPKALVGTLAGDGSVGGRVALPIEYDFLGGIEPSYTVAHANGHLFHFVGLAITVNVPFFDGARPKGTAR